jgi:hypothetical protein
MSTSICVSSHWRAANGLSLAGVRSLYASVIFTRSQWKVMISSAMCIAVDDWGRTKDTGGLNISNTAQTRVKEENYHDNLLGLVVGISSPMSVLPSGPIPYPTAHIGMYDTHL